MARIYISSTYGDLKAYREAVYRQLTRLAGHDVVAMEDYVAADERPLAKCLEDVGGCDIYIGIFAWRYGFVPKDDNPQHRCITELEYLHAKAAKKACLIFLLDENAPWPPLQQDYKTRENEAGARIEALRKQLSQDHTVSFFDTPEKLAGLVSAAVQNWERKPAAQGATPGPDAQPQFRELRNSVLLAHAPQDEALARAYATLIGAWLDKPVLMSATALFARDEGSFSSLESNTTQCGAGLLLLTPTALAQLKDGSDRMRRVTALLRARLGAVAALLCGAGAADLPPDWGIDPALELPPAALDPAAPPPAALSTLRPWLEAAVPPWGSRTIGLPVCVLAMTAAELQQLKTNPGMVGDHLGTQVQKQFEQILQGLSAENIPWGERYGADCSKWQPFGPNDVPIARIVEDIVLEINERQPPKLRHRRIKVQWYPFDAAKAQYHDNDTRLRRVYRDVARAGCVLVVDELSLFHPLLREAFHNSPFFNNDQVAMVTLSPFDPHHTPVDELLERETRKKLAGAFERYATEYDPQCELAVSDARRLKRWLHTSLPETVTNLREPRPDPEAMRAFFTAELGTDLRRRSGEYPWGGAQP
jgi:hypothetical protein